MIRYVIYHVVIVFPIIVCTNCSMINVYLGNPFQRTLNNPKQKNQISVDLLTENRTKLPENSWVKFHWTSNEIYGLPLEANLGSSKFLIKKKKNGGESFQHLHIVVNERKQDFSHKVTVCTSSSFETFLNNLDNRYTLIKELALYLLNTDVKNIQVHDFTKSCLRFSFLHVENEKSCDKEKINELSNKLKPEFISELKTKFLHFFISDANITLVGECLSKSPLKWLKSATPFLLLSAIIFIPVGISCYVCRAVRSRKNAIRIMADKKLREEQAAIAEEIKRFTQFCQLHEENIENEETFTPKWNCSVKNNKKNFIENILKPNSPKKEFIQSSQILSRDNPIIKKQTKFLNPISSYFRISTPAIKKREQELKAKNLKDKNLKRQASIRSNMNDMHLNLINSSQNLSLQLPNRNSRNSLHETNYLLKVEDEKYKKSVSFNELSNLTQKELKSTSSLSTYRKTSQNCDAMGSTLSCISMDNINYKRDKCVGTSPEVSVSRRKSILTNTMSNFLSASKSVLYSPVQTDNTSLFFSSTHIPSTSTISTQMCNSPNFLSIDEKHFNEKDFYLKNTTLKQNDTYLRHDASYLISDPGCLVKTPVLNKKQNFVNFMKVLAANMSFIGKKQISQSIRKALVPKATHDATTNTFISENEQTYSRSTADLYSYVCETSDKRSNKETVINACCGLPTRHFDFHHDVKNIYPQNKSNLKLNNYLSERDYRKMSSSSLKENEFLGRLHQQSYENDCDKMWHEKINNKQEQKRFSVLSQDFVHEKRKRFSLQSNQRSTSESALATNENNNDTINKTYQPNFSESFLKKNIEFEYPRHKTSKSILTPPSHLPRFNYDTLDAQDNDYQFGSPYYNSSSLHDSESSEPSYSSTCTPVSSDTPLPGHYKQLPHRTLSAKDRRDLFKMQRLKVYRSTKNTSPIIYEDSIAGDINCNSSILPGSRDKNKYSFRKSSWQKYRHRYESRSTESIGTLGRYLDLGSEYELKSDAIPLYEKEYARSSSTSWNNEEHESFHNLKMFKTCSSSIPGKLVVLQSEKYQPKHKSMVITNAEQSEFV
ncbi:uncharacterized protein LOC136088736 [Hydra vulgaris]|uniref:Uncharacterized protein LOC136088736 n=1 Tax=Hydra vulgaris TaxID=6087 RepID=A0ABM4D4X0_HYDVU